MPKECSSTGSVRVWVVGVGNCASSFIQGLTYYGDHTGNAPIPGLMSVDVGGLRVGDIEISSAFDVHAQKVGKDVSEAIWVAPNNKTKFANVQNRGCTV